jgi:hypothetical protein
MATTAQILANRQNAQLSTGPSSPAGRSVAARNSTRHGLSATTFVVLPHEDRQEFDGLAERISAEFAPQGEHETFLVGQMIHARWKLARLERLEQLAFERILTEPDGDSDPDGRILDALARTGNPLDKLARYQAAAERSYYRAYRELMQGRKQRLQNEAKAADAFIHQYLATPTRRVQNEPNPTAPKPPVTNAYGLGNPALRL